MVQVRIFGKDGCKKCVVAKETIGNHLGLEFQYMEIDGLLKGSAPEDWRSIGYHSIMAAYTFYESLPLVQVNNEEITEYPAAIKRLKAILKEQSAETEAVPAIEEMELAAAG